MAAAVYAVQAGHTVTVLEATRTLGGRARGSEARGPDGEALRLDNGQHILIGAYRETLALMHTVGVDTGSQLLRLPLALQTPDGQGLAMPDWPSPWNALGGILSAKGWDAGDKWSLLRAAVGWQLRGFACAPEASVAELCRGLRPRVMRTLIEPLCVSALNTPCERASGQVFLRVLRDSLFAGAGSADLLLPRTDLSALFPEPAARWLEQRGAEVRLGTRVTSLTYAQGWWVDGECFDAVLCCTPPWVTARAMDEASAGMVPALAEAVQAWARLAQGLHFEAITTVYVHAALARLPRPLLALHPGADRPAQFVFDKGQLGGPAGLLAFVVSASGTEREATEQAVLAQAREQLGALVDCTNLRVLQTIVEKRATFACTPGLVRPPTEVAPGLLVCGDYVEGPYPATLEGAVLSASAAVQALSAPLHAMAAAPR